MADGFSLNIDHKFLQNLEEADKRIQKIADTMEATSKRIIKSFQDINSQGLDVFVNKMNDVNKVISSLSDKKIAISNILGGKSQTAKSADDINKLIELLNKLSQETKKTQGANKRGGLFGDMSKSVSDWQALQKQISDNEKQISKLTQSTREYESTMKRIQSGKGGVIHGGASKEYQENIKNIETLRQQNASLQQKQQLIIQNNQALQAQANLQHQLKQYNQQQGSLPEQRKADELKRMNDYYRELEKSSKRASEESIKSSEKEAKARERAERASKKQAETEAKRQQRAAQSRETQILNAYNQAMKANEATVNQRINKLAKLRQVESQLAQDEAKYSSQLSRVRSEIDRLSQANDKAAKSTKQLQSNQRNLMDTTGQLQRKLALIFSVSQIMGYVNKLVSVRKEMELQQKSLEVLLQSKSQADRLWQQTLDLAVKSPFRVKELITYTRNLAAYRIETDKLHETTRRLSDVSAGLGVDMQRLILAYGQVRAANYLRGTELRQFTEAGIPMLDELAKNLTILEGSTVSVSDVFDRISKRLISFKDVAKVFENMTSAGGAFYRMQEEQSTTLHGMISNLHDSMDLMLNDIGKANDGFLKGSINVVKNIIENWQLMAEALQALALGFAFYKMNILLASDSLKLLAIEHRVLTNDIPKQLTVVQALKTGYLELSKIISKTAKSMIAFVASNPFITLGSLAIATLLKIGFTMHEHNKALKDITDNYEKLRQKLEALDFNFNSAKAEKNISQMKKNLLDVVDIANRDYGLKFKVNVEEMNTAQIEEKFKEISQTLFDVNIFTEGFAKSFQEATEWTIQDDVFEDIKELGETATKVFETMYNKRIVAVNRLREKESELTEEEQKALTMLSKQRADFETELDFLENLSNAFSILEKHYGGYNKTFQQLGINISDVIKQNSDLERDIQEAQKEYVALLETINLEGLTDKEKSIRLTAAIDAIASQNNWNQFVKDYIYRWTHEKFDIEIGFKTSDEDGGLLEWQQTYNEMFSNLKGFKEIEDSATKQSDIIERLNTQLKTAEELYERMQNAGEGAYSNYQLSNVKQEIEDLKTMRSWLGESDKGAKGKDWMSEVVKGIKEAHQEYIKLNKTLGESESKQMALDKYAKSFVESARNAGLKDISLGQFEFETEEGAIDALEFLKNKLPQSAKQARFKLEEAIGEIRGEVRIRTKAEDDKMLIDQIEEMFSGYEMSIELQKMNIPPDLAKQLFNIDSLTLPELRDKIKSMESKFVGTDMEEEYRKFLKKIDEMEDKEQKERLKKYVKYMLQAQSERVKIKIDEMNQFSEIEKLNVSELDKNIMRQGVREETQKKLDKAAWEDFKNSDMYIRIFEDLDRASSKALSAMHDKLIELRGSLSELSPEDLKEIVRLEEQIAKAKIEDNPFAGLIQSMKNLKSARKELNKLEEEHGFTYEEGIQVYEEQKKKIEELQISIKKLTDEYGADTPNAVFEKEDLETLTKANKKLAEILEKMGLLNSKATSSTIGIQKSFGGMSDIFSQAAQSTNDIANALDKMGALGDAQKDNFETIAGIFGGMSGIMSGAEKMASGNPFAMVAGGIQALGGIASIVGEIFAIGDKKKERQIQREIKFVEDLERAYAKLEKAINNAYSINTLQSSGKAAKDNLEAQIASYEKMIAAEEDKKKTDKDRINEWQLTIEDLIEQKAELDKQLVSTATGGIMDDVLSAAQEFTSAWLEAFNETGDGLKGLEDNFKETMLEMVKQQASMLISQSYVDKWKKQLEQYINPDDLELSTNEAKKWVDAVTTSLPQLNQALENYFTAMKEAGVDLGGGTSGELSGLQRGIQGVTEETAQIIEAYLNSIRFFVAEQNTYLSQIAASFGNTEVENPMVGQLRIIASQTTAINELLNSLTSGGHSMGGRGFRVFIS